MADENQQRCRGVLRGLQFGWNEYDGKRTPQVVARFELLDGEDKGKLDTWFASLSEDLSSKGKPYADYTIESLQACGWTGYDLSELPKLAEAGKLSSEVSLVRVIKTKDGKRNTTIKYVNRLGATKIDLKDKAMSDADVQAFAKRMKGRVGNKGASTSAPGGDDRDVPPPDESDLPW